ncbi:PREDICTED: probable G-protein coupled receptor 128 [Chrysochloris asiatica]|uniref:Adhesion G-protein coupled receptor G7 n=1 Tax=Chrysochloris asiatica TaxID=185453 RepID=A0A9B0WUR7_CHRAS|nr:PREDICTED: probable G-protein coupled receptor 128 [Chrysochloris asiatica]
MISCRVCNLRELVAIACGLVTTIVLGLGIWRSVVRIQRGNVTLRTPPPVPSLAFCRNGGTWENGRCICPEEWKGLRCTFINFCNESTHDNLHFNKIPVGRYGPSKETCEKDTANAGSPKAIRLCNLTENGDIELKNPRIGNCNENLKTLENKIQSISNNLVDISEEAQFLTSDANSLTADNITAATNVVGQIFNSSRDDTSEAKKIAVTTVSQLLDASEETFQRAADIDQNTFKTLIEQMETYSLSLNNAPVIEPNIAVQSVNLSSEDTEGSESVFFSVLKGSSNSLTDGSTRVATNINTLEPDEQTELQLLLHTTKKNNQTCGFVVYQNNKLFQSKAFKIKSDFSQKIISSTTDGIENDPNVSVEMVFNPKYDLRKFQLHSYACVFWNLKKNDWDTHGCQKKELSDDRFLHCSCNHTTNFAVLMSFKKNYNYPKSLDILSNIGCALSISGLALTITFQVVTRKVRKTSVTWVLVNLCTSMLIFNLLFVFGIENSNKNLKMSDEDTKNTDSANEMIKTDIVDIQNTTCTVMAALLHYFLLVTFAWTGLSSAQLYFLLIWTMKPLPQHFILFISLIGWGVPAIVVGMTIGIIYSLNEDGTQWEFSYRQESICWLAVPEGSDFQKSPLLWSFFLPVTVILISNVVIFIVITVKVLWRNNQNLTSTKKISSIKKILSTLSIAVVFGITWLLAYFMLLGNENITIIFSYIFCLFNTTQGLQIFIFYTVRTKVFQSEASKMLKSLSSSVGSVKSLPPMTPLRLRLRMYNLVRSIPTLNENFRLLEPSLFTEEKSFSNSDLSNSST